MTTPQQFLYRAELQFWQTVTPLMRQKPWLQKLVRGIYQLEVGDSEKTFWLRFTASCLISFIVCFLVAALIG